MGIVALALISIPIGLAMELTGTAAWIAQQAMVLLGSLPDIAVQIVIAVLATLFSLVMSLQMSGCMSLLLCTMSHEAEAGLVLLWLHAWLASFLVACPLLFALTPFTQRIVDHLLHAPARPSRQS